MLLDASRGITNVQALLVVPMQVRTFRQFKHVGFFSHSLHCVHYVGLVGSDWWCYSRHRGMLRHRVVGSA
jgi:hypothetical protein